MRRKPKGSPGLYRFYMIWLVAVVVAWAVVVAEALLR